MIGHEFPYMDTRDLNLDWLLKNMKQIIQHWATYQQSMNQSFSDLNSAFIALKSFVDNYFDNLDVQREINNKIDDMRRSGELADILHPLITSDVTDWLADHITNPSNPPVDTSLSVSGAAADAKVTGDNVFYMRDALAVDVLTEDNTTGNVRVTPAMVSGEQVRSTNGEITSNANYKRSVYTPVMYGSSLTFSISVVNVCFYKADKTFISGAANPTVITVPALAAYFIYTQGIAAYDATITIANAHSVLYKKYTELYTNTKKVDDENIRGIQEPGNLVSIFSNWVNNAYISNNTGAVLDNQPSYFCTDFLPVTAGATYKSNKGRQLAWYDSSKVFISGASGTGIQSGVTAPEGAAYLRFSVNKSVDGLSDPIGLYCANSTVYSTDVRIPNLVIPGFPWCKGNTINWIGDSIVDGPDFDEEVCSALGLTKLTTDGVNGGINGSTIALRYDGSNNRHALCARYGDMPANADIVAVSCGTNDWMYAWCPIGTVDDPDDGTSNTTFYGALKALCKGLITNYADKVIFFTTPIKRAQAFENGNGGTFTPDDEMTTPFSKNKYGKTLCDYADMIKEVCGLYSIPVLDMYRESLLNPHITAQQNLFDELLTHPLSKGQKIMARRVAGWMTQLAHVINGLD